MQLLVIGAGPAGLTAAFALARGGARVSFIERLLDEGGRVRAAGTDEFVGFDMRFQAQRVRTLVDKLAVLFLAYCAAVPVTAIEPCARAPAGGRPGAIRAGAVRVVSAPGSAAQPVTVGRFGSFGSRRRSCRSGWHPVS
jgi:phytoene dehydrogenase-like protein